MFKGCTSLISIPDISKWNTSKANNARSMFENCSSLVSLPDLSKWKTSIDMNSIFDNCISSISLPSISKNEVKIEKNRSLKSFEEHDDNGYLIFKGNIKFKEKYRIKMNRDGKEKNLFDIYHKRRNKNGKGREYFKGNIIFEGEYKNWKKNGKGKEYFKNKLIFEGNYLNEERNGFGIEYNFDDGKFVGQFKNGIKWDGTGYDKNNEIEYEIIDGNGMIKEYYNGILIYEGNYSKGKRHGDGKEYDFLSGKLRYEGIFVFGRKFG